MSDPMMAPPIKTTITVKKGAAMSEAGRMRSEKPIMQIVKIRYITVRAPQRSESHPPNARNNAAGITNKPVRDPTIARSNL